ncbi:hypothetical protein [Neobacillus sp. Marseille-QA0830]
MDKAVIMDVFDFVGFHLCKLLLNKGVKVEGVYIEEHQHWGLLEEKKLEVGRNANFVDYSLRDWESTREKDNVNTIMVISVHDFFMTRKEAILSKLDFKSLIEEKQCKGNRLMILAPVQLLMGQSGGKDFSCFLKEAEGLVQDLQMVYLPTVYGPWQPDEFLFQQAIISGHSSDLKQPSDREWTGDAIFVEDATEAIIDLMEEGKSGKYLLESRGKNGWMECARELSISTEPLQPSCQELPQNVVSVPVKTPSSITESLARQRDHTNRLIGLRSKD